MKDYFEKISIIMPTYNSEKTIEESLKSIRLQNYPNNKIEILVIDGGSTDRTVTIAKKYKAKILLNKKRLPEEAKEIGLLHANGNYALYMDSDEIFDNNNSIVRRVEVFRKNPNIKNIVATGKISKAFANPTVIYSNYVSDPFSYFIYGLNGNNRMTELKKKYEFFPKKGYTLFKFRKEQVLPLFDSATNMFDLEFARNLYNDSDNKKYFAANIFQYMVEKTMCMAMLNNDFIYHIPEDTFKVFLKKMKWRVINNVYKPEDEGIGFAARTEGNRLIQIKKFAYVLYSMSILLPFIDSLRLTVKNKNLAFMLHWPINEYTFFQIVKYMGLRFFGKDRPQNKSYAK